MISQSRAIIPVESTGVRQFGLRQNDILVSHAGVPASHLIAMKNLRTD
jgi:hypothetical protein